MKGIKTVRLGLAGTLAVALVAVGAFLLVSQASAVSGTLKVSSPNIAPGGTGTVELTANVPTPGLGAWTVDITYDPTKLTPTNCAPAQGGVCNPAYSATQVRIMGASANGLPAGADNSLGTITFSAAAGCSGTTPLTATTNVFADATIGNPQPIDVTITSGSVNCALAPTATTAPVLVVSGAGHSSDSSNWLIVAIAGAGLAALAGYGALRLRSNAV
ncbi:MAG: cohesin domain-containing protein [bacterium]